MLVPTMTNAEISAEIFTDFGGMINKLMAIEKEKAKRMIKTKTYDLIFSDEYKSQRGNKYKYVYHIRGKSRAKMKANVTLYVFHKTEHSTNVIRLVYNVDKNGMNEGYLYIYSHHFFDRYIERLKLNTSFGEVVNNYMINNVDNIRPLTFGEKVEDEMRKHFDNMEKEHGKELADILRKENSQMFEHMNKNAKDTPVYLFDANGLGCGEKEDDFYIMKTFVSNDMLFNTQKAFGKLNDDVNSQSKREILAEKNRQK